MTESAARPASVKQSLSVALGQRAPNRAQVRELGRGTGADLQLERTVKRAEERRRSRSPKAGRVEGRASRGSSPLNRWACVLGGLGVNCLGQECPVCFIFYRF